MQSRYLTHSLPLPPSLIFFLSPSLLLLIGKRNLYAAPDNLEVMSLCLSFLALVWGRKRTSSSL